MSFDIERKQMLDREKVVADRINEMLGEPSPRLPFPAAPVNGFLCGVTPAEHEGPVNLLAKRISDLESLVKALADRVATMEGK